MFTTLRLVLVAAFTTLAPVVAAAAIERVVEKSFAVNGSGRLHVETHGGGVRVETAGDSVVKVSARQIIRASTDREADDLLKKLELTLEQSGNDVRVVSRYERRPGGFRFGSWPPVNVEFVVSVPASFSVDLRTSGGRIAVGDLQGAVVARTSGGSIKIGTVGGNVEARTSGGSIAVAGAGGSVDLQTSGGNITTGRIAGPAKLGTSGGSIAIESAANVVTAHTSGGSITANIAGPLWADCSLSTSGGNVRVTVGKSAAFRLDASASGGGVDASGLTVTMEKSSRNHLAGTVNGGGPLLKLRTSGGGVVVRAN